MTLGHAETQLKTADKIANCTADGFIKYEFTLLHKLTDGVREL